MRVRSLGERGYGRGKEREGGRLVHVGIPISKQRNKKTSEFLVTISKSTSCQHQRRSLRIFVFDCTINPQWELSVWSPLFAKSPLLGRARPAHAYHGRAPAPIGPQLPPRSHTGTLVAPTRPLLPAPCPFVDLFEGFQTSHQAFIAARRGGTSRAPCV